MAAKADGGMDVRTLCLGVLTHGEATGYEVKQYFENAFAHFHAAGFGSIYPALATLADEGLVTVTGVERDGRPDKKVYRITAAGEAAFVDALATARPRQKVRSEFLVLLFFARMMTLDRVEDVLKMKAAFYRQMLDTLNRHEEAACGPIGAGPRFTLDFGRAVYGAALAHVEREGPALLEALAREREQPPDPRAPAETDPPTDDGPTGADCHSRDRS
jgi:DNA-binding PadR family transcriptional regulator